MSGIDASLPEPTVASGVDEDAPSANRHSFLDDIETPLADQDGRSAGQDVPVADEDAAWTDHGIVPPTQIDVPPGQQGEPPADGTAPLRLEDLSNDRAVASQHQTEASRAEGDASSGERTDPAGQPSHQP